VTSTLMDCGLAAFIRSRRDDDAVVLMMTACLDAAAADADIDDYDAGGRKVGEDAS